MKTRRLAITAIAFAALSSLSTGPAQARYGFWDEDSRQLTVNGIRLGGPQGGGDCVDAEFTLMEDPGGQLRFRLEGVEIDECGDDAVYEPEESRLRFRLEFTGSLYDVQMLLGENSGQGAYFDIESMVPVSGPGDDNMDQGDDESSGDDMYHDGDDNGTGNDDMYDDSDDDTTGNDDMYDDSGDDATGADDMYEEEDGSAGDDMNHDGGDGAADNGQDQEASLNGCFTRGDGPGEVRYCFDSNGTWYAEMRHGAMGAECGRGPSGRYRLRSSMLTICMDEGDNNSCQEFDFSQARDGLVVGGVAFQEEQGCAQRSQS